MYSANSVNYKGKERLLKKDAYQIKMENLAFGKRIHPDVHIGAIWQHKKQILKDLASILAEQIKLGVSHGDLIQGIDFLPRGQKRERHILLYVKNGKVRARSYDYGLGKIVKNKVGKHMSDYNTMTKIIKEMFKFRLDKEGNRCGVLPSEVDQIKNEFDQIFEKKISKMKGKVAFKVPFGEKK